jgi:hypothetical protein
MATYEININMVGGNGKDNKAEDDKTKVPSKDDKTAGQIAGSVMMYVASKTVQPFIQQTISSASSRISLVTGKKSVAEKINFGMNMANKAINTVSTATAGYAMGKTMGIGGGGGAILAITLQVVTSGISLAFKNAEMKANKQIQNLQSQMIQSRAGVNVNSSREGI